MKLRFNYGHYFQVPALANMYTATDTAVVRIALSRGNTILGNIMMKPEKTVMYEVGIENQLTNEIVFGFTSYFKDIYDLSQIRTVTALPMSYFQFFNVDYGNIKGFEFRLSKVMSNNYAASLGYTLQFAKGTASFAGEFYNDFYLGGLDPITGLPLQPPVIDYWLDFDERHIFNANFDVELPGDFVFVPLQDISSSLVLSYHSGHPYTPTDLKGNKLGDENSARMPGFFNVDWTVFKRIVIGPARLALSAIIQNMFNGTQVVTVYNTTGQANDHGDYEPPITQFGNLSITTYRYSPQADFDHDGMVSAPEMKEAYMDARTDFYEDPTFYNPPLRIQFGIGFTF